jgi:hypothetical protein
MVFIVVVWGSEWVITDARCGPARKPAERDFDRMNPFLIAGVIVGVVIVIVLWRRNSGPSVIMFEKIDKAIRAVHKPAMDNVRPSSDEGEARGFDESAMQKQIITVADSIRFIYAVEKIPEGFLHTVSSQLQESKNKKYHIQCMLVVMLTLNRRLAEVGIKGDDVKFDVNESAVGTQYVSMLLTSEQHQRFLSSNNEGYNAMHPGGNRAQRNSRR